MRLGFLHRRDTETRSLKKYLLGGVGVICLLAFAVSIFGQSQNGNFQLVSQNQATDIFISENDFKVVKSTAEELANDVKLITDLRPDVKADFSILPKQMVLIGTLRKNETIQKLIETKKIDVSSIQDKRE